MRREDCFIDATTIDLHALLHEWRWLTGSEEFTLVKATALGDLFVKDAHGRIFFLDTIDGRFTRIADSEDDLSQKLDVRANRDRWLSTRYIQLAMIGGRLGPGQCYGWKIPPIAGGEVATENMEPTDLLVHHSILGQLVRQARAGSSSGE